MNDSGNRSQLCFALDVTSVKEAESWVSRIQGYPIIVKLGLKLLPLLKADFFDRIKKGGQKIFIDAKLHDIPSQVADAVGTWNSLGADYLTIHLSGGAKMIQMAAAAAKSTEILGVSVLTSMTEEDFSAEADSRSLATVIDRRIRLAQQNGVGWVVCAATDVPLLRKYSGMKAVTPGLSFGNEKASDQNRVATVKSAVESGVEMLVVGRSILQAPKPESVIESILDLISSRPK